jgi:hypothetical protein
MCIVVIDVSRKLDLSEDIRSDGWDGIRGQCFNIPNSVESSEYAFFPVVYLPVPKFDDSPCKLKYSRGPTEQRRSSRTQCLVLFPSQFQKS